jgi:parallel beta-helix repeat protein
MKRILTALFLLAGAFAAADEGQRYIHQPAIITEPGEYRVVRNLAVVTGSVLTIDADGVDVDLGGHTLASDDSAAAVLRIAAGHTDISIHDGALEGGLSGIIYDSATGHARIRVEQVRIQSTEDDCIYLVGVDHVELLHSRILGCAEEGVHVQGMQAEFTGRFIGNEIANVHGGGLYLFGLRSSEVRDNQIVNAGMVTPDAGGIVLTGNPTQPVGGNTVSGNRIVGGPGNSRGIHIAEASANNRITGNVLAGNGGDGLLVESRGNRIVDNLVNGGGLDGIHIDAERNTVRGNQVQANGGEGIRVERNFNLLDGNLAEGNGSYGIWFDAPGTSVYRNNMLRDNGAGTVGGGSNTNSGGNIL